MATRARISTFRTWALPLLLGALVSGCGESSGLTELGRPPTQGNDQYVEEPLIPLQGGYLIGASVFSSIETFLKYAEAIGTNQYDTQEYFNDLYPPLQLALEDTYENSLKNSELNILSEAIPEQDPHSKIITTDSVAIPQLLLKVSIKSVSCSQANAAQLTENTSAPLTAFLTGRISHLKLINSKSQLERMLDKGQALLITVYGPDECWIEIIATVSRYNP